MHTTDSADWIDLQQSGLIFFFYFFFLNNQKTIEKNKHGTSVTLQL